MIGHNTVYYINIIKQVHRKSKSDLEQYQQDVSWQTV